MQTAAINEAVTIAVAVMDACICVVILARHRLRDYPAVFSFAFADLIAGLFLYAISQSGDMTLYRQIYLTYDITSFLLQIVILYEVAKQVLRPTGAWTQGAFKPLLLVSSVGVAIALVVTVLLQPAGLRGHHAFELRADMFASLLTCELVIAMMISAKEVGLGWRNHVMAIGQGLMFWSLTAATIEGMSIYLGPRNPYQDALYYIRVIAYMGVLSYWTVSLWRNEPARKPISPALRKYVLALHERVHYDLGKVGH